MTQTRFADLGRLLAGPTPRMQADDSADPLKPKDENQPDDELDGPDEEDEDDMTIDTESKDYKAGATAGADAARKAANERFNTVIASEHYAGREKLAAELLKSEMSADQITGALAAAPVAVKAEEPNGKADDADEKDRQLMRDRLQGKNPDLGNDDEPDAEAKAKAENHGWDKIHAEVEERRKLSA